MGTRPRVAVEVRPEGVVAARAEVGAGLLAAISRGDLPAGALRPGLKAGNILDRAAVVLAVRRVLDGTAARGGERSRYVTLVIPDTAVRVLLLDFDALPTKPVEALAVVRFRLKKLLPFDAEHAVVTYQVMSSGRDGVRVLAVAMPCDVLSEYEGVVTDAGYLPGAVLPSTLAALAGLDSIETGPALVVNAGQDAVTTAIVQGGVLLLHRNVDLGSEMGGDEAEGVEVRGGGSPLGRPAQSSVVETAWMLGERAELDRMDAGAQMQAQVLRRADMTLPSEPDEAVQVLNATEPVSTGREITQAVSVAAAYFEDTLGGAPPVVLAAGSLGAERLGAVLGMYGMDGMQVREIVDTAAIGPGAGAAVLSRGLLAGVRGALRS